MTDSKVATKVPIILGGLMLVAFVIRLSLFFLEPLIPPDGLSYTESGINLVSGKGYVNSSGEFRGRLQPLYPIFIGFANLLVHDHTFSGPLVSMIFGSLLIWPVFQFCKTAYDTKTAFTASAIVVVYPFLANYASTALTEATYTFFLFLAAWWGWLAFRRGRTSDYTICGVVAGLGYLTRFEIAGYVLLYLVFVFFASHGRRWKQLLMLTVIFLAMITPYHVYNWLQTGSPMLLGRLEGGLKFQVAVLKLGDVNSPWYIFFGDPVRFAQRYIKGIGDAYTEYLPTLFPPLLIATTAAGLAEIFRRGTLAFTEVYLCTIVAVTLFGYPLLRPSGRNLTVALPFLVVLLAKSINEISPWVSARVATWRGRAVSTGAIAVAITVVVCASVLPQTYRPLLIGTDPLAPIELMEMGKWMKANLPPVDAVATWNRTISFYAGARMVGVDDSYRYEDYIATARSQGVRYVAVTAHGPSEIDWYKFQEKIREGGEMRLVHSIKRRPKMAVQLYELIDRRTLEAPAQK